MVCQAESSVRGLFLETIGNFTQNIGTLGRQNGQIHTKWYLNVGIESLLIQIRPKRTA
jgi:hypothetical protein